MERIEGVIFDLDGTLYTMALPKLRLTLTLIKDLNILRHLSPARSSLRGKSFGDRDGFRAALFEELAKRAKVDSARAKSWYDQRFSVGFIGMLRRSAKRRPGLNGLLGELKKRGVRLGVVSDYDFVSERLEAIGIEKGLFGEAVAAEEFGVLKPSALPFDGVATRWGLEPNRILVVGDRRDLDEQSAEAAGMGFLGVGDKNFGKADHGRYESWSRVAEELNARTAGQTTAVSKPLAKP